MEIHTPLLFYISQLSVEAVKKCLEKKLIRRRNERTVCFCSSPGGTIGFNVGAFVVVLKYAWTI